MNAMSDKKKNTAKAKGKVYPSRAKTKYVGIPGDLFDMLLELGKTEERSAAYYAKKAIAKWLADEKGIKYPS
jgi:hypothetical protein